MISFPVLKSKFSIDKRPGRGDHFRIRGLFDIFCTQGSTSTPHFLELEKQYRHFKVYETGWSKTDRLLTFFLHVIFSKKE